VNSPALIEAIDALLSFVKMKAAENETAPVLSREDVVEFNRLDADVFRLAAAARLDHRLPNPVVMAAVLHIPQRPLAYLGQSRLPGDWDAGTFCFSDGGWFDEMAALRIAAADSDSLTTPQRPQEPRLTVDLEKQTATLDGIAYDVKSVHALRWIAVLAASPGVWFSGPELKAVDPELDGVRTDRLKKHIPSPLLALIDSETGRGSRLKLPQ